MFRSFFHYFLQFVEGYTAKILDLITTGLGPDQLCLALNVCPGTQEVVPVEEEELLLRAADGEVAVTS